MEQRAQTQKYRLEQAEIRMKNIEEEEKARCRKTAEILKEFERKSCNGPFFESLLDILTNFQGNFFFFIYIYICRWYIYLYTFFLGGINSVRRTVKCLNETLKQLTDSVRTVQEDQMRMSQIIETLASKVPYFFWSKINENNEIMK